MAKNTPPALETALDNLETLVERMESGDLTLEESLKAFEEGVLTLGIRKGNESWESREWAFGAV